MVRLGAPQLFGYKHACPKLQILVLHFTTSSITLFKVPYRPIVTHIVAHKKIHIYLQINTYQFVIVHSKNAGLL